MQDVIVNNRMIGEFMGGRTQTTWIGGIPTECFYMPDAHILDYITDFEHQLPYDSSWDYLMPVVDKIESYGYDSRILGNDSDGGFLCDFVDGDNKEAACAISYNSKIEAVYMSCVEYIKWHNSNKKQ